jgi:tetratricopeptide (TPR) repeat protein
MLNQVTVNHKLPAWLSACFLLCAFGIILFPSFSLAQDRIYKSDKTVIEAKVIEINGADIKYKKFSNPGGPTYIVPKKEVSMIEYENGEKEVYDPAQANAWQATATPEAIKNVNVSREKARSFILAENINGAIASYSKLLTNDQTNATLLAEDAYALALGGVYDAALIRLDMSWKNGSNSPEVKFYTAQVFSLMGYDDLAREFWKATEKNTPPVWISAKAVLLLQKFSCKQPHSSIKDREQLIAGFKRANELASQNLFLQSIAIFQDITTIYPDEYLPYIGYSITLEKTGVLAKSAQTIEKAISLIGNSSEDKTKKQFLEQRLAALNRNMTSMPTIVTSRQTNKKEQVVNQPQMMAYAGGNVSPQLTMINGRIGYFISGSSNASFDFGVLKNADISSTNIGLSLYNQQKGFVSGAGLMLNSSGGTNSFAMKLSVGYSKMNKSQTACFNIFLDFNRGLKTDAITSYIFSIGSSVYFGNRK